MLLRRWQQEVAKVTRKNAQSRQAHQKLVEQQRRADSNDAVRRRVRVDVLTAWTNARLKDDHIERIKREGALSIASELQKTSAVNEFSSLQERCGARSTGGSDPFPVTNRWWLWLRFSQVYLRDRAFV